MMLDIYSMAGKNEADLAVAHAEPEFDELALWDLVESLDAESLWKPLKLTATRGQLTDYPPCDVVGRICSPRLIDVINQFTSKIKWLPVEIIKDGVVNNYAFMHFPDIVPIADTERSKVVGSRILEAYILESAIIPISIMVLESLSNSVVITSEVKRAIEHAGCEGIDFQRLPSG